MSLPEAARIWKRIPGAQLGAKFRRQHPIGPYVTAFCCLEARLVVEIDGDIHGYGDRPKSDAARDKYMIERGFSLLRIAAVDVLRNADTVAAGIAATVANPLHHPSDGPPPRTGEEL
jgi:very-short-patch-repair endonuclease